jgi:hypothetical protein
MPKLNAKTNETFIESLSWFEMIFHNMVMKNITEDRSQTMISFDEWSAELRVEFNPELTDERCKDLLNETMESYSQKTITIFPYNDS